MKHLTYSTLFVLFSIVSANIIHIAKDNIINHYDNEWNQWKYTQDRNYGSVEEEKARKEIFIDNLMYIEAFNKEEHSFTLGVNKFADMTNSEYREAMLTNLGYGKMEPIEKEQVPKSTNLTGSSIDWRSRGAVGAIKDQGLYCGCGWAFSAVGSLEGQYAITSGGFEVLSEQEVLDCSARYGAGSVQSAYSYWLTHGEERQSAYPYKGRYGTCSYDHTKAIAGPISNYYFYFPSCYSLKYLLFSKGPMSVAMDASQLSFQFYREGIYSDPSCSTTNLNHAVLVVAYYDPEDYYWVKNSFGGNWGISGNFKIKPFTNTCGICQQVSYPKI